MSALSPLPPAFPAPLGLSQVPAALALNPLVETLLALSFEQEASLAALAERDAGDELAVFEELRRASE